METVEVIDAAPSDTASSEPPAESAPPAVPSDEVYLDAPDPQGSIDGFVGAAGDVSDDECELTDFGWIGSGRVDNPTEDTVGYRIYVAFLDATGDTAGLVQTDVDEVASGEGADYEVVMPAHTDADDLTCVLRVERFVP